MNGNTSFFNQLVTFSWVVDARLAAVFSSQDNATASKVWVAAIAFACFASRLNCPGSIPSARSLRAAVRFALASMREISGYAPKVKRFCFPLSCQYDMRHIFVPDTVTSRYMPPPSAKVCGLSPFGLAVLI